MSSCCTPETTPDLIAADMTVALAGNPNSGKTTIFNALTGLRQKVANYPGITVEKKTGRCRLADGRWVNIVDLPGTYSLISRSPDERVAMEVLRGLRKDTPPPDAVVVVVDASNLQRNLYLVSQLIELGRPLVVALNMMDVARRRGLEVSAEVLERELGVPVVPVVGVRREGIDALRAALLRARVAPQPDWSLPKPMVEEVALLGGGLAAIDGEMPPLANFRPINLTPESRLAQRSALAERLLIGDHADDIAPVVGNEAIGALLSSATGRLAALGIDPMQADIEAHYRWIDAISEKVVRLAEPAPGATVVSSDVSTRLQPYAARPAKPLLTQKLDAILLHKFWGFAIFAVIMTALFISVFSLAQPLMDLMTTAVDKLGAWVTGSLPDGPIKALLADGIFAGVGAVVVFVPQIALLFLFLAVLEDSGYLARAAFLMDRLLAKVGLHGKSFIPLLSSFACAIPGIMATRTIENRKDRLATIFVAPFMSCSARLPVYFLLIGTFFSGYSAWTRGGIMAGLYLLGIVAAGCTAWLFKRTLLRGPAPAFILEFPTYKLPQISLVARQVWFNTSKFLTKAGTIIFCLSVLLWASMYYGPADVSAAFGTRASSAVHAQAAASVDEHAAETARLDNSFAGKFGHALEPVIAPLGYDWKMGVGLVSAFAAREVFVSTMGIVYSVGDPGDDTGNLQSAMRADTYASGPRAGKPVWTPLVAASLLVWFVLAMQCMSTLAVVRRETGTWRWPLFMLLYMNVLAYVLALGVYQVGRLFVA